MSGNCATGSAAIASSPAMVMTVETTKASRGRRMNSDEMVMALLLGLCRRGRNRARRHGHALAHALLALDDDLLARLQALADHQQSFAQAAGLDPPQLDHVLVVDHEEIGPRLIEGDGLLRDRYDGLRLAVLEDHADGLAVGQHAVLV